MQFYLTSYVSVETAPKIGIFNTYEPEVNSIDMCVKLTAYTHGPISDRANKLAKGVVTPESRKFICIYAKYFVS